jgi:hypothetical protein
MSMLDEPLHVTTWIWYNTVTWRLKVAICPSAGQDFTDHVPMGKTEGAVAGWRIVETHFHSNEYDRSNNAFHTESR